MSQSPKKPLPASTTPSEQAPDLSIDASDQVHLHAAGYTHDESTERLMHSGARFRSSPLDFLREVSLHVSGTGWRSYDKIIGQPIFYSGFSEQMKMRVLSNGMLVQKMQELARRRVEVEAREGLLGENAENEGVRARRRQEIEGNLLEVCDQMTENMICKMESKRFIRGAYYVVTQMLTRAYHQGAYKFTRIFV